MATSEVEKLSKEPFFRSCPTYWMEDVTLSERALEIWPNIIKEIQFWESLGKLKRPDNKLYMVLVDSHLDPLLPAKLQSFHLLEEFS